MLLIGPFSVDWMDRWFQGQALGQFHGLFQMQVRFVSMLFEDSHRIVAADFAARHIEVLFIVSVS